MMHYHCISTTQGGFHRFHSLSSQTTIPTLRFSQTWSRLSFLELLVSREVPRLSQLYSSRSRIGGIGQPLALLLKANPLVTEVGDSMHTCGYLG